MMKVYKATAPGMKARLGNGKDHPTIGLNITPEANCTKNGWHCAENPLDCLSYFSWDGKNEFYLCEAEGDIHESGYLSVVSCTELTIKKRLSLAEFVAEAVKYIICHPLRPLHSSIHNTVNVDKSNYFGIASGEQPTISAAEGCVVALIRRTKGGTITAIHIEEVGEKKKVKPGIKYGINPQGALFEVRGKDK